MIEVGTGSAPFSNVIPQQSLGPLLHHTRECTDEKPVTMDRVTQTITISHTHALPRHLTQDRENSSVTLQQYSEGFTTR